jgi:predicted GIY-YIG superfamily endonuclease
MIGVLPTRDKSGHVYIAEITFRNGRKKIYVGQTGKTVYKRIGEHFRNQNEMNIRSYVGKGVKFRLIGSLYSKNRFKAEKTIKKLPRRGKIYLGREGAKEWKKTKANKH